MSSKKSNKFIVLKNNVLEQENNSRQQFYRRRRYNGLLCNVLDFLTIDEQMNLLTLNKNISNIINSNNILEKVKMLKLKFFSEIKKLIRYKAIHRVWELQQLPTKCPQEITVIKQILPVYFYKYYKSELTNQNLNFRYLTFYFGELITFFIKNCDQYKLSFFCCNKMETVFNSFYFPQCNNLTSLNLDSIKHFSIEVDSYVKIFNLRNLKEFKVVNCFMIPLQLETILILLVDLKETCKIKHLDFSKNKLPSTVGQYIANFVKNYPRIKSLIFESNNLGDGVLTFVKYIDHNCNLKELNLTNNKINDRIGKLFFLELYKSRPKNLQVLNFDNREISDRTLRKAASYIKRKDSKLKILSLINKKFCREETMWKFIKNIKKHCVLMKLGIKYYFSNPKIKEELQNLKNTYGVALY